MGSFLLDLFFKSRKEMKILKVLNPLIWCWNHFKYTAHLQMWADMQDAADHAGKGRKVEYEHYDYDKYDTKYF